MRPITDVLREYRNGRAVDLASREFSLLNEAVNETGLKGEITIKIKVAVAKGGGAERDLQISITSKIPRPELPSAVFFADQAGDLHRTDPAQREMFKEAGSEGGARPAGTA
jgi:hypothetical protein